MIAGWENITVFAEPGSKIPHGFTGDVVSRRKQFGDWSNWACGLYELLLTEPDSDYFLMVEDDAIVCKGAKWYLEEHLPDMLPFASVSMYCPSCYKTKWAGFYNHCHDWKSRSTVTIIMSRQGAIQFFSDPDVQRHRFEYTLPVPKDEVIWGVQVDPLNSIKDAVIGMWAYKNDLPMFYHSPSLAQHIGETSTLTTDKIDSDRAADDFVGVDFEPNWSKVRIKRYRHPPVL